MLWRRKWVGREGPGRDGAGGVVSGSRDCAERLWAEPCTDKPFVIKIYVLCCKECCFWSLVIFPFSSRCKVIKWLEAKLNLSKVAMGLDKAGSENLVRVLLAFPCSCELCVPWVWWEPLGTLIFLGGGGWLRLPFQLSPPRVALHLRGHVDGRTGPVLWTGGLEPGVGLRSRVLR